MADRELFLRREFGGGAPGWGVEEERVVAKPILSPLLQKNASFEGAHERRQHFALPGQRDRANEPRPPVGHVPQPFEQEMVVGGIAGPGAGKPCGIHARRPGERIHGQS